MKIASQNLRPRPHLPVTDRARQSRARECELLPSLSLRVSELGFSTTDSAAVVLRDRCCVLERFSAGSWTAPPPACLLAGPGRLGGQLGRRYVIFNLPGYRGSRRIKRQGDGSKMKEEQRDELMCQGGSEEERTEF
eukprot:superscaffoldBa00000967_g8255